MAISPPSGRPPKYSHGAGAGIEVLRRLIEVLRIHAPPVERLARQRPACQATASPAARTARGTALGVRAHRPGSVLPHPRRHLPPRRRAPAPPAGSLPAALAHARGRASDRGDDPGRDPDRSSARGLKGHHRSARRSARSLRLMVGADGISSLSMRRSARRASAMSSPRIAAFDDATAIVSDLLTPGSDHATRNHGACRPVRPGRSGDAARRRRASARDLQDRRAPAHRPAPARHRRSSRHRRPRSPHQAPATRSCSRMRFSRACSAANRSIR